MSADFIEILKTRGFLHQMTDEAGLATLLKSGPATAYIGFDCTAKSLHVGSLLQIMLLRWWQKTGNKPIVLLGGGTTKIGDPSGKDESRPPLTDADIQANMDSLKQVFSKFITFGNGKTDAVMVNNDDWLKDLNYVAFLRDYGRHFSVNRMMSMDSVKLRLEREQNLSFLEFNYMILQAYDFVELNRKHGCRVQMGGSDQWGNIVNGIELSRRLMPQIKTSKTATVEEDVSAAYDEVAMNSDKYLFGITSPLLTTSSGAKMGKTAAGAVWLNADMLKPYDYWQYWRNTEDADVVKFLKLFTELSLDEIAKLGALEGAGINEAKKVLATEATALLHGREAAQQAARTAQETFEQGKASATLPKIPAYVGVPAYKLLVAAGVAASNGEARRFIKGGGFRINDEQIKDDNYVVTDLSVKVSAGKTKHFLLVESEAY
ncbi:MAG: tyrosine--tRNA ligase [Alphaproteobacteria bacterium]|nr:tyrosine--tRNA ligase [Alphaproteobacteria bacterium]